MLKDNRGFTLIEVAVVLSIIAVLIGFSLKGRGMLEMAKVRSLASQIENYRIGVQVFFEQYGALPHEYKSPAEWKVSAAEPSKKFWANLKASKLVSVALSSEGYPKTKLGGLLGVKIDNKEIWLILCQSHGDGESAAGVEKVLAENIKSYMLSSGFEEDEIEMSDSDGKYQISFKIW